MLLQLIQMESRVTSMKNFDVIGKLGEGAFGQVMKVKRKADGKQYALKKVKIGSMKQKERENALNEIRILASYNEEYIIGYKEAFYEEVSGTLCIVMEFASGGDMLKQNQTHIKKKTKCKEEDVWRALVHMTKGLKSLHDKKILHRNLKCANVFITADGSYKLGDLNVSKVLKKDMAQTQTGTPYYASPEVWKDQPYNSKSDIWSLGCVLYEMAALKPPFTANDLQGLYKKVCVGICERIPFSYSNQLWNIISSMLKVDPSKRPNVDQILSNPMVHKNYKGHLEVQQKQGQCDPLLKTIKYNPKDLRGLKQILPKANYDEEKQQTKPSEKLVKKQSSKSIQITKEEIEKSNNKLEQFLNRRKELQEKQRLRKLKQLADQKQQMRQNRERVLSACGMRQPYRYEAPRIAVHHKDDDNQSNRGSATGRSTRKDSGQIKNLPPKMPPKQPGYNLNYKLPPKPSNGGNQGSSKNILNKSRQSHSREKSKQNLRNLGQNIVQGSNTPGPRIGRSSSSQRIVYPSWWG